MNGEKLFLHLRGDKTLTLEGVSLRSLQRMRSAWPWTVIEFINNGNDRIWVRKSDILALEIGAD